MAPVTRHRGQPALGYRLALEVDPKEAARVRQVFELVASGLSARATGRQLGMDEKQIRRVLSYEPYKQPGELRIVTPALWARAHRQLAKRRPR